MLNVDSRPSALVHKEGDHCRRFNERHRGINKVKTHLLRLSINDVGGRKSTCEPKVLCWMVISLHGPNPTTRSPWWFVFLFPSSAACALPSPMESTSTITTVLITTTMAGQRLIRTGSLPSEALFTSLERIFFDGVENASRRSALPRRKQA